MSELVSCVCDALQRQGGGRRKFHRKAACPEVTPELLAEQDLNIGLVVDHENKKAHARSPEMAFGD